MLATTSHVFLKEIGRGPFHKITNCGDTDHAKLFHLATRRKRFPWSRYSYEPLDFVLADVMLGPPIQKLPVSQFEDVHDFSYSSNFKVSGKIGATLASFLTLEIDACDKVLLQLPLGKIEKQSVNMEPLVKVLNERVLDLNHPLLVELCQAKSKGTGLSIVTETLSITNDAKVTASADISAGADAEDKPNVSDGKIQVDSIVKAEVVFPASTVLAFRCLDLQLDPSSGAVRCHLSSQDGTCAAFCCPKGDRVDAQTLAEDYLQPPMLLEWLELPSERLKSLRAAFCALCAHPANVHGLARAIFEAEEHQSSKLDPSTKTALHSILTAASRDTLPPPSSALRRSLEFLIDSLSDLPDEAIWPLAHLSPSQAKVLLHLVLAELRQDLSDFEALQKDGGSKGLDEAGKEIAQAVNLDILPDGVLAFSGDRQTLESLVRVLRALFTGV